MLGIIEGITEFLPISSTGHLILTGQLLRIPQTDFLKSFEIIIQLGAIFAVVTLYGKKLLLKGDIVKRVLVAFVPTGVIGLLFYSLLKRYLLGNANITLIMLFLGGIALIAFELKYKEPEAAIDTIQHISYKQACIIGLFQSLALIPGVSRAAATIMGGLLLNIKRETIVMFSFLLAIPTLGAATGLDLLKNANSFSEQDIGLLAIGFITSFLVALAAIKFFLAFIKTHTFIPFGVYRILVALVFWITFIR
jgi:undecaprenyl-diphosphatase